MSKALTSYILILIFIYYLHGCQCSKDKYSDEIYGSTCRERKPKKYYYDGFKGDEEDSNLNEMVELSKPTLRTLLRGLVTLFINLFPDCMPKQTKKDDGVKIFRQIVACPPFYTQPGYAPHPHKDQIPQELQELIDSRTI